MKIVVTGGSGFLGSHVADELSKKGQDVTIFDKKKTRWIRQGQKIYVGNILNVKDLKKVIKGSDIVFHFAALSDLEEALHKPIESVTTNILGTVNVLELSKKYNIKRIVYASSIYSMSTQGGFYRCSKKAAEDYIEEYNKRYGLSFTILSYGSLYGPRTDKSNGVFRIIDDATKSQQLKYIYGNRSSVRKYIHVLDAARATANVISKKYKNKYINIVGIKSYKVTQLLKIVSKSLNISSGVKFLDEKTIGRYIKFPKLFKLRKGINYKFKKTIKLEYGIQNLINHIKKS